MTLGTWFALLVAIILAAEAVRALRHRAFGNERWRRFFRHPTAAWGVGMLAFLVIVAVAAPLIAPFDPDRQLDIIGLKNHPPSWTFLLGTDVLSRDVLPKAAAPIIVSAARGGGNVLLLEASLSFLGIGIRPPTPSWGNMIADGAPSVYTAPWTTVAAGLAISLVVMSLNAVADGLRDALDPHEEGGAT